MTAPYMREMAPQAALGGIGGMLQGPDELAPADATETRNPMPDTQQLMGIIAQLAQALQAQGGGGAMAAAGAPVGGGLEQGGEMLPQMERSAGVAPIERAPMEPRVPEPMMAESAQPTERGIAPGSPRKKRAFLKKHGKESDFQLFK